MVCSSLTRIVAALWLAGVFPAGAFTPSVAVIEDFSRSAPASVPTSSDEKATSAAVTAGVNALDGSPAAQFTASLVGRKAGWAGINVPVSSKLSSTEAAALGGAEHIEMDLKSEGETRGVYVTLTEQDGSRWNTNLRVSSEWRTYQVPLYQFTWFMGPSERKETRPMPGKLKSIDLWTGNGFQGLNGFSVDNIRMRNDLPDVMLRIASVGGHAGQIDVQADSTIVVETTETTGGPTVPFSGRLWVEVEDRNKVIVPQTVPIEEGRADIPVFVRDSGAFKLFVYEPHSGFELEESIRVNANVNRVRFNYEWEEGGQPVVFAMSPLKPSLLLKTGRTSAPLSGHTRMTDMNGRLVAAINEDMAELRKGRTKIEAPAPGVYDVEFLAVAEPLSELPQADAVKSVPLVRALRTGAIDSYVNLPAGVTTETVVGRIIPVADLPSTATIVARDRFRLWALAQSPVENAGYYRSPFGICSAALFHMKKSDISGPGKQRLRWHRKLGSYWGRNDLWWHEIEPSPGKFDLEKLSEVVAAYAQYQIKLTGILCYGSAWAKDGAAPSTPEEREKFRGYLRKILEEHPRRTRAFEVWNEPNIGYWKPEPDMDAYRELVKVTWEEMRGGDTTYSQRIVAGATAGYDPVFLEHLLKDGWAKYYDVLSFHPYPEALGESPEANNLPDVLQAFQNLKAKYGANREGWITEIGWPTGPIGVSEADQANYLLRTYVIALAGGIDKVFWFNLYDWERLAWKGEFGAHTGLMDSQYRPKLSFSAYNLLELLLSELIFAEKREEGNAVIYSFDHRGHSAKFKNGRTHIAWTTSPDAVEEVDIPIIGGSSVFAVNYLGAEQIPELISKAQGKPSAEFENVHTHDEEAPRAAAAETSPTLTGLPYELPPSDDDEPTTRTYRFRISHEPLYILDVGRPEKKKQR